MKEILKVIGVITLLVGFITGIAAGLFMNGFHLWVLLGSWFSGLSSAMIFFALAMILEHVENLNLEVYSLSKRLPQPEKAGPPLGNSKMSLKEIGDYKMGGPVE